MKNKTTHWKYLIYALILLLNSNCKKEKNFPCIDGDGNLYKTVTIGSQVWMAENLKTTKYSNGDLIGTTIPVTKDITNESSPKYQWPVNGDENDVATYGRLYTWFTVTDSRNVCPRGWHVPTKNEWYELVLHFDAGAQMPDYGEVSYTAGKKLKEAGVEHWLIPNTANNESGFTALPGGLRCNTWPFTSKGYSGVWWTTTKYDISFGWSWQMDCHADFVLALANPKEYGFSVRCLQD